MPLYYLTRSKSGIISRAGFRKDNDAFGVSYRFADTRA
jgi:hypothetical protein